MDINELTNHLATGIKDHRPPDLIWTGYCNDREMCRSITREGVVASIVNAALQKAGDYTITRRSSSDRNRPWNQGRQPDEADSHVKLSEFHALLGRMHDEDPPIQFRTINGLVPEELHVFTSRCDVAVLNKAGESITFGDSGIIFRVRQTLWTPAQIDIHMGRLPSTPKHEATIKHFFMDFFDKSVEGYCLGQTWNGWRVPYFTKAQMEAVMDQCNRNYDNEMDWHEGNVHVPCCGGETLEEPEVWFPVSIEGVEEPVWSVGGMSWVWSAEDTAHEEDDSGEWLEVTS